MPRPKSNSAEGGEFGATGRYPLGSVAPQDEGELRFGLAAHSGRVLVDFGKPVHSLGLDADQADGFALLLIKKAEEARRQVYEMLNQPADA